MATRLTSNLALVVWIKVDGVQFETPALALLGGAQVPVDFFLALTLCFPLSD